MRFRTKNNSKLDTKGVLTYLNYVFDKIYLDNLRYPFENIVLKHNGLLNGKYKTKWLDTNLIGDFLEYYEILKLKETYNETKRLAAKYDLDISKLLIFYHYVVSLHMYDRNKEINLLKKKKITIDYKKLFSVIWKSISNSQIPTINNYKINLSIASSEGVYIQDIIDSTLLLLYYCVNQKQYGTNDYIIPYPFFVFFEESLAQKKEYTVENNKITLYNYLFNVARNKKFYLYNKMLNYGSILPFFELFQEQDRNYLPIKFFSYKTYHKDYYYNFVNSKNYFYEENNNIPIYQLHTYNHHSSSLNTSTLSSYSYSTPSSFSSHLHPINKRGVNCYQNEFDVEMIKKLKNTNRFYTFNKVYVNAKFDSNNVIEYIKRYILSNNLLFKRCHWLISEINMNRISPNEIKFALNVNCSSQSQQNKDTTNRINNIYTIGGRQYNELCCTHSKSDRYVFLQKNGYDIEVDLHSAIFSITRSINISPFNMEWDIKEELLKYNFLDDDGNLLTKDSIKPLLFTIYFASSENQAYSWYKNRKFPKEWLRLNLSSIETDKLPLLSEKTFRLIYQKTEELIGDKSRFIHNIFIIESFVELYIIWRFIEQGISVENVYDCFYFKSCQIDENKAKQFINKYAIEAIKQFNHIDESYHNDTTILSQI